jgi:hypothetical protein
MFLFDYHNTFIIIEVILYRKKHFSKFELKIIKNKISFDGS